MESVFTQTFEVSAAHVDCFGRAKPSSLLYFAQEAAGGHCRELALDWDTLAQRNLFWAVLRYRVQIAQLPRLGQTITVQTWPMPTTRTAFPRATAGYDEQGNELFRIIGLWVLMDRTTRTLVLPGKSGIDLTGSVRGGELATPGTISPIPLSNTTWRQVGYTELDRNAHMNNTKYLDWVDDLLPATFHKDHPVTEFTLGYLAEALEGDDLCLHWQLLDGPVLQVDARRENPDVPEKPTRVFTARLQF